MLLEVNVVAFVSPAPEVLQQEDLSAELQSALYRLCLSMLGRFAGAASFVPAERSPVSFGAALSGGDALTVFFDMSGSAADFEEDGSHQLETSEQIPLPGGFVIDGASLSVCATPVS